jgi:hypothetical protein
MASAVTPAIPLIDWHSLLQVLYISAACSIGLVLLFTLGVYALSSFQRRDTLVLHRGLNGIAVAFSAAGILATVVWGFYYIVQK